MKVTKLQYDKWNNQLENGWRLDLQDLVVWGEKRIKLFETHSETKKTEYQLSYQEVWEEHTFTGFYDIKLTKREWTKSDNTDCYMTQGLGCSKTIVKKASDKKVYKNLVQLSKDLSLEDVKSLFTGNEVNPLA